MQLLKNNFHKVHYVSAVLLLLLAWHITAAALNKPALPPPHHAFYSFFHCLNDGLISHIKISLFRVTASLFLAILLGVPLGLLLGKNPRLDHYCSPVIYLTYPVPKIVLMPVILILLGIGNLSKIVLITLIVFYQILVTTRDAAKNMPNDYILSVQSLDANSWQLYRHVYLPGCLPSILTSLRLGLGTAMAVLFLVETYATQKGVGYFIMDSFTGMAYQDMFAGIIAMALMGFLLYIIIDRAEKIFCSWINP